MPVSDWTPALTDVGAQLRMRTRDATGATLGTFTDATTPTGAEVEPLIDGAVSDLATEIGGDIAGVWWDAAKRLAAIATAMQIELGYFGDLVAEGRSPYEKLKEMFDERLPRLKAAIDSAGAETPGDADMRPQGDFTFTPAIDPANATPWSLGAPGDLLPGISWPSYLPW